MTVLTTEQVAESLLEQNFYHEDVCAAIDSFIAADSRDLEETGWGDVDIAVVLNQLFDSGYTLDEDGIARMTLTNESLKETI